MKITYPSVTGENVEEQDHAASWLKRLGVIGFLFFFIKGLVWLILPFVLVLFGMQD